MIASRWSLANGREPVVSLAADNWRAPAASASRFGAAAETTVARSNVASVEFFRSIHSNSALLHGRFHRPGSRSHPLWGTENRFFVRLRDCPSRYLL